LSAAFTHVAKIGEHGGGFVGCPNPIRSIERLEEDEVKKAEIWTDADMAAFLDHFKFDPERAPYSATQFVPWMLLALHLTGLRPKTLFATKLEWIAVEGSVGAIAYPGNLKGKRVLKNDKPWTCPLDVDAAALVAKLAEHQRAAGHTKLFHHNYANIAKLFADNRKAISKSYPRAAKLIIYGQRHTWTTKNLKHFHNTPEMLRFTGRSSVKDAMNYVLPGAMEQARMLEERRAKEAAPAPAPAGIAGIDPAKLAKALALLEMMEAMDKAKDMAAEAPSSPAKLTRVA
jgi:hypothetical protein